MNNPMQLDHLEQMNDLLDWYQSLLTDKQRKCMFLYYYDDYSLSEIAEEVHTSRSAVFDIMKRTEHTLIEYENKLHCVENFKKRSKIYEELSKLNLQEVDRLVEQLKKIDTE
ncbi:MAG: YlxM family DNA-binding protein [Erysipelotrichaceae bacterium]|nr:YlxM family DNA-binding protein [Erysipelotrichaceae bacterium]